MYFQFMDDVIFAHNGHMQGAGVTLEQPASLIVQQGG